VSDSASDRPIRTAGKLLTIDGMTDYMTATVASDQGNHVPTGPPVSSPPPRPTSRLAWRNRQYWRRFTPLQLLVMAVCTIPVGIIAGALTAGSAGVISTEEMIELALAAGENPGTIVFGAMFLATPIQWATGRTQIRVRKYLGIVFYLLALNNGAMFLMESGTPGILSEPFLIAGTFALALATPLFATSSRWSQRRLGMSRWRLLHKLTYVIALALLGHVILIGDLGLGAALITIGFVARTRPVRRWLQRRGEAR
jgi:DMSO/TMAO reductase YedYZ heme-binding membrane subunit